jgi:uncharacterized protein (TIGR03437 family)
VCQTEGMLRAFPFLVLLGAGSALGSNVQLLSPLPNGAVSKSVQLDAAGDIYMAGYITPQAPKSSNDISDVFVAKLSPDGSTLLYLTSFGGSSVDEAAALALGSDGSVFVTGFSDSTDFPVTAGTSASSGGFLAKLNPAGSLVYASFLGGAATALALDSAGDVFVTGTSSSVFPATSGSVARNFNPSAGFILKFDPTLSNVLLSINGYGSGLIALDSQGNIYIAGLASVLSGPGLGYLPSLSANGFQSTHATMPCSRSLGPSGFGIPCSNYQYVAKIDPTGTKLLWATYVTGTYGATPGGMAVDSEGNVILAGTTNSDDYPVTPGAFQTAYAPAAAPPPNFGFPEIGAPAATGYITKLNAMGTALVWSTYFGGSQSDYIGGMTIDAGGNINVSGLAGSADLPGLSEAPPGCRPSANQGLGFVARITPDGASASNAQLIYDAPACLYESCGGTLTDSLTDLDFSGWPLALRPDGTALVAGTNGTVADVDFSASSRLACIADVTDNAQLSSVAPGQLISLFGTDLAPATPYAPPGGVEASSSSLGVFFSGVPAPILYTSAQQINVQVPYEIAGQSGVQMQVTGTLTSLPVSESRTLAVAQRQPSVFLSTDASESPVTGFSVCGSLVQLFEAAVALNADGTLNDCTNPAAGGSIVTIFLNGLGPVTPAQTTGAISAAPAVALTPAVDPSAGEEPGIQVTTLTTTTVPGSISGVAQVRLQLPQNVGSATFLTITLAGAPTREKVVFIWTLPN